MKNDSGFSLVELLAVLAILGIAVGAASLSLRPIAAPLQAGTDQLEGFMRQTRARAMSTTSAYRVSPNGSGALDTERASSCGSTTWTADPGTTLGLPEDVNLADTTWALCFSPRGIADSNLVVTLVHPELGSKQVEILLGGTTRVLP